MTDLALPEAFKGRWRNLLIMTYNADVPFFERTIWPQLVAGCRNKIILVDGHRFLQSSADWARDGTVRHLNQLYLGAGIFTPQAAHAKLILLTNEEAGRLLVGSGNLSISGYASGGEVFSQYEYNHSETDSLSAFVTIREFINELLQRDLVPSVAHHRINTLFENTPWLYSSPSSTLQPVRHNLNQSFLAQMQVAVGDENVEELWVHAPFHDTESRALAAMLNVLRPNVLHLLVQPDQTSLNPESIAQTLAASSADCVVHEIRRRLEGHDPYIHAKFYIAKLQDRAICLHGSPNFSQVALLLTPPQSNIELANLLIAERDRFDGFLHGLHIQPFRKPLAELSTGPGDSEEQQEADLSWYLIAGEWDGSSLTLQFRGSPPDFHQLELLGTTGPIFFTQYRERVSHLEFTLSDIGAEQMRNNLSVKLQWIAGGIPVASNPVFICNRAALNRVLETVEGEGGLESFGALDLADEELEQLLGELDASFPIDRRSVWQMAGRTPPDSNSDGQEELQLSYAEIDRDALRRHPRMQQYFHAGRGSAVSFAPTRLQIVLNMINAHFLKLHDGPGDADAARVLIEILEESDADSEEEREEEEAERRARRISSSAHIRRLMHNFIERFLRGLQMEDYRDFVGHLVIAQNSIIFQHLLWRLFYRDWSDPHFLMNALQRLWTFLWQPKSGFLAQLPDGEQSEVLHLLRENKADALLMAGLFHCAKNLSRIEHSDMRLRLRDFGRNLLALSYAPLSESVLHDSWIYLGEMYAYSPPMPSEIVQSIGELCQFETASSFLRSVEKRLRLPNHSCSFEWERVFRSNDPRARVRCLKATAAPRLPHLTEAMDVLIRWHGFERLDYYRANITTKDRNTALVFFDVSEGTGLFRRGDETPVEITAANLSRVTDAWALTIERMYSMAERVEDLLTMPVAVSVKHSMS